ncbi:MAG: hypothetical protein R6U67_05895 [Sodalinema sp.]|uniref:hypothetical protein n=1 Tax=Sodalinema sp. TaxID=3080550 RepID=UPI00396F419C
MSDSPPEISQAIHWRHRAVSYSPRIWWRWGGLSVGVHLLLWGLIQPRLLIPSPSPSPSREVIVPIELLNPEPRPEVTTDDSPSHFKSFLSYWRLFIDSPTGAS